MLNKLWVNHKIFFYLIWLIILRENWILSEFKYIVIKTIMQFVVILISIMTDRWCRYHRCSTFGHRSKIYWLFRHGNEISSRETLPIIRLWVEWLFAFLFICQEWSFVNCRESHWVFIPQSVICRIIDKSWL